MSIKWTLVTRKLNTLIPYPSNPRILTEKGMADLSKSIAKFGLAEPLIINQDGTIIGGHGRYYTLQKQGIKQADCYIPDRMLNKKEVDELNIRLNKNIAGTWDMDILANEFELPDLTDWGFNGKELGIIDEIEMPVLKDGDREPFQQMTFTLSDEQVNVIKAKMAQAKKTEDFKYCETYGNENGNGNALYFIVASYGNEHS